MYTNIKTANRKKLQLKALVDSGYIYTRINEKTSKNRTDLNWTKNREVMRFILLELKINE